MYPKRWTNTKNDRKNLKICAWPILISKYNQKQNVIYKKNADEDEFDEYECLNADDILKEREKSKVIRFRSYKMHHDPDNYFRELVMLYHPWRTEDVMLIPGESEKIFNDNQEAIQVKRLEYNQICEEELREIEERLIDEREKQRKISRIAQE